MLLNSHRSKHAHVVKTKWWTEKNRRALNPKKKNWIVSRRRSENIDSYSMNIVDRVDHHNTRLFRTHVWKMISMAELLLYMHRNCFITAKHISTASVCCKCAQNEWRSNQIKPNCIIFDGFEKIIKQFPPNHESNCLNSKMTTKKPLLTRNVVDIVNKMCTLYGISTTKYKQRRKIRSMSIISECVKFI